MIVKPRSSPFVARMGFDPDATNVGVQIVQYPDVIVARSTDVNEIAPGVWEASLTAPSVAGDYAILWDADLAEDSWRWEDLRVTTSLYLPGDDGEEEPSDAREAAKAELAALVMPEETPALDNTQMESLLDFAQRADSEGRAPSDEDWTPTYDLNAAAAEGWQRKAGLASSSFDFAEDDQRFNVGQIHNHCIAQARLYRNRAARSVRTSLAFDA